MSETNWPEILTQYTEKRYQPKANQGYQTRQPLTIRADGKDMEVAQGVVLRFDQPGLLTVYGSTTGGSDYQILLSTITLVEAKKQHPDRSPARVL